ncbi:MAG: periplasmic binding domain protein [Betaproteobacteria bacterium]|nr:periplasmic binding domain protein [Betaproteobacteria bacterium]
MFDISPAALLRRAAGLALCLAAVSATAQPAPIKIGFLGELSGPQGALGQDQYDGFMLVVERNGRKLGGVPVDILKEDTQLKPDLATQIVQKLIERDKVSIITGVTFSTVLAAVAKPIEEAGVFLVLSNGAPSSFAGANCSALRFVTSWQNDQQAEVVGKYAAQKGYKKMVLMAPNFQGGRDYVTGFKRQYTGVVADEMYTPLNQLDFSAEISKIAAIKPDAVFVFYPGGLGINFIRQFKGAGLLGSVPLLSASTADGITLVALKDTARGVISGSFWGPDTPTEASRQFVEQFEKKYNRIPSQYAAQSYDAALLLDSAIAKVKGNVADKQAFGAALKAADFKSVRGDFKFNNNNFPIHDMRVFEVAPDAQKRISLKTIGAPLRAHEDAYHAQCALK